MTDPVIVCEDLGKSYRIAKGTEQTKFNYVALRDVITDRVKNFGGRGDAAQSDFVDFWALRNFNLKLHAGERLGIVGHNGAGKSTMLKLLSRITEPSSGVMKIKGRVASLLEIGTGFHPELNGRENIFLNGAILGMTRTEIKQKFDEIVEFAGIEEFLETPVKRYSSGMYVRLGFAVAAHLESEILIVDEVLAVGDAKFQQKCLGKMGEISDSGRTILFVSHNLNAVERLCDRIIVLNRGEAQIDTKDVAKGLNFYMEQFSDIYASEWTNELGVHQNPFFHPTRLAVTDSSGTPIQMPVPNNRDLFVSVEGTAEEPREGLTILLIVSDENEHVVFVSGYHDGPQSDWPLIRTGKNHFKCRIPSRFLNEGNYLVQLVARFNKGDKLFGRSNTKAAVQLKIEGGLSDSPEWITRRHGVVAPVLEWSESD